MHGQCHDGGEMATAEPRNSMACAREGQEGEARAAFGLGVIRGVARNWRWRRERPRLSTWPGKRCSHRR
jgi:hypothetical protein